MKNLYIEKGNMVKVALVEDNKLKDLYFENYDSNIKAGDLIVGVIKNKVSQFNGLFIDIGDEKNAFMEIKGNYDEYIIGKEILVEVLYKDNSKKGFKVTDKISIGGESVVLFLGDGISLSKKINFSSFKEKHGDFEEIENYRILFRGYSLDVDRVYIKNEIEDIKNILDKIIKKSKVTKGPVRLYESKSFIEKIIRKNYRSLNTIYTNSKEIYKKLDDNYNLNIIYEENNLFLNFGLEEKIQKLLEKEVILENGSNIVIEKTEAMHVIDVNSSQYETQNNNIKNDEEYALSVNKDSLKEIVRQIKLRNLSGIIIVDFISMKSKKNKKELLKNINELIKKESLSFKAYPLSKNSTMEIVREKKGEEIYSLLSYRPSYNGILLNKEYLVSLIISYMEKILSEIKANNKVEFNIHLNFLYGKDLIEIKELLDGGISERDINKDNLLTYKIKLKKDIMYYDIEFDY